MTIEKRLKKILGSAKIEYIEATKCALYLGAHINNIPVIQINGKLRGLLRTLFEFHNKRSILPNHRVSNLCGKKNCINPKHWRIPYETRPDDQYGFYLHNWITNAPYIG